MLLFRVGTSAHFSQQLFVAHIGNLRSGGDGRHIERRMLDKGAEVERLITEIPTISKVEETAANLGLTKIETTTRTEFFEFENGAEFISSPLVANFLLPVWLDFLNAAKIERFSKRLAQVVNNDDGKLTFRFSVKASLVVGEKS